MTINSSAVESDDDRLQNNDGLVDENMDRISARGYNPSKAPKNPVLTESVKTWIVIPTIIFGVVGFVMVVSIFILLIFNIINHIHEYVLVAIIITLAGMPFGYVYNIKNMKSAFTFE